MARRAAELMALRARATSRTIRAASSPAAVAVALLVWWGAGPGAAAQEASAPPDATPDAPPAATPETPLEGPAPTPPPPSMIWAADGEAETIAAAVAALGPSGGVVVVPPGEWGWGPDDEVTITRDDVTIVGAAPDSTLLFRRYGRDKSTFFRVTGASRVRISGLRIRGITDRHNADLDYGVLIENGTDVRVDHCSFGHLGFAGVRTDGATRCVIDHCRFSQLYKPPVEGFGYAVAVYGDGEATDAAPGTVEATVVEDCEIQYCRHAITANRGGRYVFRRNHVTQTARANAVDAPGSGSLEPGVPGAALVEIYRNVIEQPNLGESAASSWYAVRIRGGRALIWDNRFGDVDEGVRIDEFDAGDTGPVHLWDNTLERDRSPGALPAYCRDLDQPGDVVCVRDAEPDQVKPPADGRPEVVAERPRDYTPLTYPHPLVADMVVRAGPDRVVLLAPGRDRVTVELRGTVAVPPERAVESMIWSVDGDTHVLDGPTVSLHLGRGQHAAVLQAVRDDGWREVDAVAFSVIQGQLPIRPAGPREWLQRWIEPQAGHVIARFILRPDAAGMDGYAALTGNLEVLGHADNAAIVRVNQDGYFDVRDGDGYRAEVAVPYEAGRGYRVVVDLDVDRQVYSVSVEGIELARDYRFRLPVDQIAQLVVWYSTGSLAVEELSVSPAAD